MDVHVSMLEQADGTWVAETAFQPPVRASARSRVECLAAVRGEVASRSGTSGPIELVVDVTPRLAGVAEAAEVMGWDKRRVITYIQRGSFPAPIQALASGRVWRRSDIEAFAAQWRARQAERAARRR